MFSLGGPKGAGHYTADLNVCETVFVPTYLGFYWSVLAEIGASPHTTVVADAATVVVVDAAHASVIALAMWASERLATVAALDPETYGVMRSTMDSVIAALHGVVDSQVRGVERAPKRESWWRRKRGTRASLASEAKYLHYIVTQQETHSRSDRWYS